ncbi:hypothetical protein ACFV0H_18775 [Streptomyces erythrochromogenes]|uniref:hypothetical protein n=1 Tax=Streptomyces erythrochromogenes TaxID=285574 RepID=UPI00369F1BBC
MAWPASVSGWAHGYTRLYRCPVIVPPFTELVASAAWNPKRTRSLGNGRHRGGRFARLSGTIGLPEPRAVRPEIR